MVVKALVLNRLIIVFFKSMLIRALLMGRDKEICCNHKSTTNLPRIAAEKSLHFVTSFLLTAAATHFVQDKAPTYPKSLASTSKPSGGGTYIPNGFSLASNSGTP
eukprot:3925948-Ditylum_brightwellii.AAC.1